MWTLEGMRVYLQSTESGRKALEFYHAHADPTADHVRIWRAEYIRGCYRNKGSNGPYQPYYVNYGTTSPKGKYGKGAVDITLVDDMDDLTAAATFVHEMEHAQWWWTGEGGYEVHARLADIEFYVELGALDRLPSEYFDREIVTRNQDTTVSLDRAKLVEQYESYESRYEYSDEDYTFGPCSRIM
jgi:hypothetical protein